MSAKWSWLREHAHALALAGMIAAYVVVMSRAQIVKYESFDMGFDLALQEQIVWNTAHGRWFATSTLANTEVDLGRDVILLDALLALPYKLLPDTRTLLVVQTVAVALAVLPLYGLARIRLGSGAALTLSAAYMVYLPIHLLNLYEFQLRAFALGPIFAMFYFLERDRPWPFVASMLLALTTRSDVALVVAMFGVYALVHRRRRLFSVAPLLVGSAWFLVAMFVVVPAFNKLGHSEYLDRYAHATSPLEIVTNVLRHPLLVLGDATSPEKLSYLAEIFGPLGFLALLRPDVLLLALPTLGLTLLSSHPTQWDIHYQYGAMLYPVAFVGAVMTLSMAKRVASNGATAGRRATFGVLVALLLCGSLATNLLDGAPAWALATRRRLASRGVQAVIDMIPPTAAVGASGMLGAHVARRERLYLFPAPVQFYSDQALALADYLLIEPLGDRRYPVFHQLKWDPAWTLVAKQGRCWLYRRVRTKVGRG